MNKLGSRKFWILILTLAGMAGAIVSGEVSLQASIWPMVTLVLGYFGVNVAQKFAALGK